MHEHKRLLSRQRIEALEIDLGFREKQYTGKPGEVLAKKYYDIPQYQEPSRAFTSPVPINPTTGEELEIQPSLFDSTTNMWKTTVRKGDEYGIISVNASLPRNVIQDEMHRQLVEVKKKLGNTGAS